MSRMTKFLRQQCLVQPYQLDEHNNPQLNDFGELQYEPAFLCKCRHEIAFKDIQTTNGQLIKSTSRYFLDDSVEIKADYKIDDHTVLNVSTYINSAGQVEGYEVYV